MISTTKYQFTFKMTEYPDIKLEECLSDLHKGTNQAAHCLLWFALSKQRKQDIVERNQNSKCFAGNEFCLMQVRSDGQIGFPGGFIDEKINSFDDIVTGLNRELCEEINLCDDASKVKKTDYAFSSIKECEDEKLILHFFIKKLSEQEFASIESNSPKAIHYLIESFGLFRVPLRCIRFLENFLTASNFCGNSRSQLIRSIDLLTKNKDS